MISSSRHGITPGNISGVHHNGKTFPHAVERTTAAQTDLGSVMKENPSPFSNHYPGKSNTKRKIIVNIFTKQIYSENY